mmetsp:Transcript_23148/g.32312  ORF Transcript_23148/g.32312 Transcript_23148/m.32312 type:complete len:248 (-) Transcript_23148:1013-1756(-)
MFIDTCCSFYGPSTNTTFEDDRIKDKRSTADDATAKTETVVIDELKSEDTSKSVDDEPVTCPGKVRERNLALIKEREEKERVAKMKAATLIQSRTRTLLEKKQIEERLRQQSATCIQRHARGMISRKSSAELIVGRIAGLTRLLAIIVKNKNTGEANEEIAPMDQERDEKIEDAVVDTEKESDRESIETIEKTEKTKKSSIVFKKVFSFTKKRSNNSQNSAETNKFGAKIPPKSPKNMLPRHLRRKA